MNVYILMLAVTACYTITSLSDKYAVSVAKFNSHEFTFLMCSSMSVFIAFSLPFQTIYITLTWQSCISVLLIATCKILEFEMSALVLKELSAFELKAWLGLTLFASYLTDIFYGTELKPLKLLCIVITIVGLTCIARSGKDGKIAYHKIILPLSLYLFAKYSYALVIRTFSPYIAPTLQLLPALVLISLIMLTQISPAGIPEKSKNGTLLVILARFPNAIGMLLENAVIAISLTNYSFIQPLILVTLFLIGLLRRERCTILNLIGSIICIIGVITFQLV